MSALQTTFVPDIHSFDETLKRLDALAREPQPEVDDDPIFLASIGWRTGSTLTQRILMTDPSMLIWGEPMDKALVVGRMTQALSSLGDYAPAPNNSISHRPYPDLARDWVASLGPDNGHLKAGMRALFDAWLAKPARDLGFSRWGVKEVRWSGQDARALRWLYPKSKFLLVVRHPVSAYQSILQWGMKPGWGLWVGWPDRAVDTLESYAAYWNEMALSWAEAYDMVDARLVRYEDLISGALDLAALGDHLDLDLKPDIALSEKSGGSHYIRGITADERDRINELTASSRALFAYAE